MTAALSTRAARQLHAAHHAPATEPQGVMGEDVGNLAMALAEQLEGEPVFAILSTGRLYIYEPGRLNVVLEPDTTQRLLEWLDTLPQRQAGRRW